MRLDRILACGAVPVCCALLASATPLRGQETYHEWVVTRYELWLFDRGQQTTLGDELDAWHYTSIEAGARRSGLTSVARLNWASRFADGFQLEADLYPSWPGVGYAYFSGGWSDGDVFPDIRLAGELFAALPAAFEASAGVVYMDFGDDDVAIVVGSLSKYTGNHWLSVRPSFTTGAGDLALTLIGRRYLRTPGEFVTLRLIGGTAAEEIVARGDSRLETLGGQVDAQIELTRRFLVLPLAGMAREELPGGTARMRYSLGLGGMLRF